MTKSRSSVLAAWSRRAAAPPAARSGTSQLHLLLPAGWPDSRELLRWQTTGPDPRGGELHDLDRLPPELKRLPLAVWSPAAETILTSVTLPTRSRSKIAQALPYALEDRIVGDPEALHYAWQPEGDGSVSVAITNRARIQQWLEGLKQAGLRPDSLSPATLLIPWSLDGWSAAFVGNELLVRSGPLNGFVCPAQDSPPGLLLAALHEARAQPNPPDSLVLFSAPRGVSAEAWGKALGINVRAESGSLWERRTEARAPLNLLQGLYEQKKSFSEPLRPYRVAIALAALWIVSSVAFNALEWWRLRSEDANLTKQMTTLLLSNFPETKTEIDPAAQMQKAADLLLARRGQGGAGLVPLLAKSATALRTDPRIRLRALRYAENSVTLEVTWPAAMTTDAARATLEGAGLRVEVQGTNPKGELVEGKLRVLATDKPAKKGG
jgi:general secretion pathway protein L